MIASEIQVSYKNRIPLDERTRITKSDDAFMYLREVFDTNTIEMAEEFIVLFLDNSHGVKGHYKMSKGGMTGTLVDIRILMAIALKTLSSAIVIAHNHPSGKLAPSEADKTLTKKIREAALLMDIKLLDHLIVSPQKTYYSFADQGIL